MTNIKQKLHTYAKSLNISDIGVCDAREYTELLPRLMRQIPFAVSADKRISPSQLLDGAKSVIMCAFNYYTGDSNDTSGNANANLARYARGKDYHNVVTAKLDALAAAIQADYPDMKAAAFCDNSPMCDKYLAYLAGLGFWGRNSLLIHPVFGSYTFIGGIITDLYIEADMPLEQKNCSGCGNFERARCAATCPAKAITADGVDAFACVSRLTQKKGTLTECETAAIQQCGNVWGCDICADVCPHNAGVPVTDINEFLNNLIYTLDKDTLLDTDLTGRAFAWRGKDVLMRNIELTSGL